MNAKKVAKTLNAAQIEKLNACTSISDQIRFLNKEKMSVGDIERTLSSFLKKHVRYQWVRNVLVNDKLKAEYSK